MKRPDAIAAIGGGGVFPSRTGAAVSGLIDESSTSNIRSSPVLFNHSICLEHHQVARIVDFRLYEHARA